MRREIRIGLLLAATACLLAVLVDWAVEELISEAPQADADTPQADVGASLEDAEEAQATAEGSDEQG
jgi:hypothetical protein